jgi:hypothetical protein
MSKSKEVEIWEMPRRVFSVGGDPSATLKAYCIKSDRPDCLYAWIPDYQTDYITMITNISKKDCKYLGKVSVGINFNDVINKLELPTFEEIESLNAKPIDPQSINGLSEEDILRLHSVTTLANEIVKLSLQNEYYSNIIKHLKEINQPSVPETNKTNKLLTPDEVQFYNSLKELWSDTSQIDTFATYLALESGKDHYTGEAKESFKKFIKLAKSQKITKNIISNSITLDNATTTINSVTVGTTPAFTITQVDNNE